ncbi:MAG: RNA polymerase sigma factor [Bacteroidaceae bacterium]|jgi:RNA polymerase sigma-70 factor (ECF subfamily)|nr:RNA polymerase sigma factor [Bacteroidaceae bacterium]
MNLPGTDEEIQIIEAFRRGESTAMDRLYAKYANYLTSICARYIANDDDLKDVLQESFIKIFTQISTFENRGKGALKAWMSRIVVNESLQFLRREQKTLSTTLDVEPPDIPDEDPDTEGVDAGAMTDLIRQLPDGYRAVLNLYVLEGKSHKEIAEILGIKADSSASQLHRAKNMLARMIKEFKRSKQ